MTKSTNGSWHVVKNVRIDNAEGKWVASAVKASWTTAEEAAANAALIAAAPDLLAALCVAIESLQAEGARAYDPTNKLATAHIDRAVEAARAAIAKAEGRQ